MKIEFMSDAVLDEDKFPKPAIKSQAHRERCVTALNPINFLAINNRMKVPPFHESTFAQLATARARRNQRFLFSAGIRGRFQELIY
jgi:hypothetical protein